MPSFDDNFIQAMIDDGVLPLKSPLRYQQTTPKKITKKTAIHLNKPSLELTAESSEIFSVIKDGADKRLLKKLKHTIDVDSSLDLHGLNKHDATYYLLAEINHYSHQSATLKIIHGKSAKANELPVLKSMVKSLLTGHPKVIAFCSAPQNQGGAGATFALLKP